MWTILRTFILIAVLGGSLVASDKKIVCYFGSWSVYRQGNGKFAIEDIDPSFCTHLIYAFVGINDDGSIKILDQSNDIDNGGFKKFNALKEKNANAKTLVAVGGYNQGSETFSKVAASAELRGAFVKNTVDFLKTNGFDGFDFDWEYPAQRGGSPDDKANFGIMVKEFRTAFDQNGYLLSAAVGATATAISKSYDVPTLSQSLDFINVMTYDLHGSFDGVTGENAPLQPLPSEVTPEAKELNVAACIDAWINNGAASEKLVLGIGAYGRSFTLDDPAKNGLGAPASQPGTAGPYTAEAGTLSYLEICEMLKGDQWKVVWNEEQKVPYAFSGNQWVGYDDTRSVTSKAEFGKEKNLGGLMIWSLDQDDFRGSCGDKYPILSAIKANL